LPPQIVIIATEDNTLVKYTPTARTSKVKAGQTAAVTIHRGQCLLIESETSQSFVQKDSSDLTGTYIVATKPIGILSGHTKASFPKLQATLLGRPGNFMRNTMIEMIPPIDELGTEYISAPLKYAARPRGIVPDDSGDLIRFVATENGTVIQQMRSDGSDFITISNSLKRGQWFDIVNQEKAAYYKSNKKVLVGQYGKTWLDHLPTPEAKKDDELPLNPSSNGQGMMMVLTPNSAWTSYSCFKSAANIDNWVYLVCKSKDLNKITFDGKSLVTKFGNSIKYIDGTDYAWLASDIAAGDHYIIGDTVVGGKDKARFAGYAYGNWDRSKDGFAYGYPISRSFSNGSGIDSSRPYIEPIYFSYDTVRFGTTSYKQFKIKIPSLDINFDWKEFRLGNGKIGFYLDTLNFPNQTFRMINRRDSATFVLAFKPLTEATVVDSIGIGDGNWFKYLAIVRSPQLNPIIVVSDLDLGTRIGNSVLDTVIRVTNAGTGLLIIDSVLLPSKPFFTFNNSKQVKKDSIFPGEIKSYLVKIKFNPMDTIINDKIIFKSNANSMDSLSRIYLNLLKSIKIKVTNVNFLNIPPDSLVNDTVKVSNLSKTSLLIIDYKLPSNNEFNVIFNNWANRTIPLVILPNQTLNFLISFKAPKEYGKLFNDSVVIYSNATEGDSIVKILASSLSAVFDGKNNTEILINYNQSENLIYISTKDENEFIENFDIYDISGKNCFSEHYHSIQSSLYLNISTLSEGAYIIVIKTNQNYYIRKLKIGN